MGRRIIILLLTAAVLAAGGCGQRTTVSETPESVQETAEPELPPEPVSEAAEPLPEPAAADFVRVTDHLPQVRVDLRYAGEDNFTGQTIYDFTDAYLRYGTVQKLAEAQARLEDAGTPC